MSFLSHNINGFFLLVFSLPIFAMDIRVTEFDDRFDGKCDHDCSLREAVQLANTNPDADRILLSAGTYFLEIPVALDPDRENAIVDEDSNANGDLDVIDDLIIQGSQTGETIIDALLIHRIIETLSGNTELINLTFKNGITSHSGGGIENHATLTLRHCTLTLNRADHWDSQSSGGGIANWGVLNIYSSVIDRNWSNGRGLGPGGGIYNEGTLTVRDSTISRNSVSGYDGGGVGGGLYNVGTADVRRSLFYGNRSSYFGSGSAAITAKGGTLRMVNTTVSGHADGNEDNIGAAVANGGGAFPPGKLYLTNVTITDSANYGIISEGDTFIRNSIISGNKDKWTGAVKNCLHLSGRLNLDNVLIGRKQNDITCYATDFNNDKTFTTLLAPLANNGGPTLTHALRKNSPAIDAGFAPCASYDQRAFISAVDGNNDGMATCDLGAVEYQPDFDILINENRDSI